MDIVVIKINLFIVGLDITDNNNRIIIAMKINMYVINILLVVFMYSPLTKMFYSVLYFCLMKNVLITCSYKNLCVSQTLVKIGE